jgi:hypothetical protein
VSKNVIISGRDSFLHGRVGFVWFLLSVGNWTCFSTWALSTHVTCKCVPGLTHMAIGVSKLWRSFVPSSTNIFPWLCSPKDLHLKTKLYAFFKIKIKRKVTRGGVNYLNTVTMKRAGRLENQGSIPGGSSDFSPHNRVQNSTGNSPRFLSNAYRLLPGEQAAGNWDWSLTSI